MRQIRSGAGWLHLLLAAVVMLAVPVQVYLIGSYFFGAGQGALDAHKNVGFAVHPLEVLVLIVALVAWLPRTDILLSLTLAVVGTIQIALASAHKWAGGLHPLFAMVVLALATLLTLRRVRARRTPAPA
jgi:hypothetical protein